MLLAFPLAVFLMFYAILREKGADWRRAVLAASVFLGASLAAITETLSLTRLVTRGAVASSWLAIAIASAVYLGILRQRSSYALHGSELSLASADRTVN
jgi:hypothetical protein